MKSFNAAGVVVFLLWTTGIAQAQGVGASGEIQGSVTDPTGSAVPNTRMESVDTERGTKYTAHTDSSGEYRLTGLPPGTYDVTAQSSGFGTVVHKGVVVSVGAVTTVDFMLA